MNPAFGNALAFILGAVIGSFLNVCIHRMPRDLSIVLPGSFCPQCKAPILWYHNIPIVSYVLLRGKCVRCKRGILPRYFFIELLSALTWLALWMAYGLSTQFGISVIFVSLMIVVVMTDFETGLIPDQITFTGMIAGLCLSVVNTGAFPEGLWYHKLFASAVGLLGGGAILWITGWLGSIAFKKDAMGGGDVKLLAMIGAFLGIGKTALVFMLSPFLALPYALFYRFVKKEETIPYGPFLAVTAVILFLKGGTVMELLSKIYGV